jgi:hypothetical protein
MRALVAGIHVFLFSFEADQNVDGRDKPGHDDVKSVPPRSI